MKINEANSYGWEVPENMAREAYEFACDRMGKEFVDDQIVDGLSMYELASSLAYLFRIWNFEEWDEYLENEDDEYIDESLIREAMNKLLYASDLDIEDKLVIPNDKYSFVITDNGCYDLTKKGIYPVYTWVGKQHSSSRSLTPKQLDKLESFVYNIVVPAMAKYCNVDEKDVKVNDFTNSTDMYRVWVDITDKKENESCKKKSKKKSMKEYIDEAHGVIKCVETGEEYGYSSLVDREWIIADLVDKGYTYKDRPVRIETGYREYDNYLD